MRLSLRVKDVLGRDFNTQWVDDGTVEAHQLRQVHRDFSQLSRLVIHDETWGEVSLNPALVVSVTLHVDEGPKP